MYATDQLSVRVDDLAEIAEAMARIRPHPPAALLDEPVTDVRGPAARTPTCVIAAHRAARVVVRPSGTEPKLKAYLEVVEQIPDGDVSPRRRGERRRRGRAAAAACRAEIAGRRSGTLARE